MVQAWLNSTNCSIPTEVLRDRLVLFFLPVTRQLYSSSFKLQMQEKSCFSHWSTEKWQCIFYSVLYNVWYYSFFISTHQCLSMRMNNCCFSLAGMLFYSLMILARAAAPQDVKLALPSRPWMFSGLIVTNLSLYLTRFWSGYLKLNCAHDSFMLHTGMCNSSVLNCMQYIMLNSISDFCNTNEAMTILNYYLVLLYTASV